MHYRKTPNKTIAAAVLSVAALAINLAPTSSANAADDLPPPPLKAAKPVADIPFFLVVDDRLTFSYQFTAGLFVYAFRCVGLWHQLRQH
jgi:hypothetical protein